MLRTLSPQIPHSPNVPAAYFVSRLLIMLIFSVMHISFVKFPLQNGGPGKNYAVIATCVAEFDAYAFSPLPPSRAYTQPTTPSSKSFKRPFVLTVLSRP